jgi:hypothetical protein
MTENSHLPECNYGDVLADDDCICDRLRAAQTRAAKYALNSVIDAIARAQQEKSGERLRAVQVEIDTLTSD